MDKTDILNKLASYPARWFLSFSQESGNSFLTSALKILFKNGLKASGDFAVENLRISTVCPLHIKELFRELRNVLLTTFLPRDWNARGTCASCVKFNRLVRLH